LFSYDDRKKARDKAYTDDTENDSDLIEIAKRIDTEYIFDSNYPESLKRLKKFFVKNRKKLVKKQDDTRISLPNSINILPPVNPTSYNHDSSTTVQNDISFLNKKRNKN